MTTFAWKLSYQNEREYEVRGHSNIRTIEAFSVCRYGLLEYQFRDFNGLPEEFRRTMRARQGGVIVRYVDTPYREGFYWQERRWTPEFYAEFVTHLKESHASYLAEHEVYRVRRGYTHEEYPIVEMDPIPRPIFYDPETRGYETEPWWTSEACQ